MALLPSPRSDLCSKQQKTFLKINCYVDINKFFTKTYVYSLELNCLGGITELHPLEKCSPGILMAIPTMGIRSIVGPDTLSAILCQMFDKDC